MSSGASSVTNIGSAGSALNGVISTGVTLGSGGAQLASPTSAGQNAATIAGTAPSPGSITFNSANDSADYLSLRSFTVEQWFRLNALPASGNWINLLYRGTDLAGGSARNFSAWIYSTGYVQASIYNSAGTNFYVASAAGAIVPQTWYHMVFTFDGSVLKLYINGQPASATVMIDTPVLAGPNAGVFALDLSSSSNRFNGQVSDMAIYTNALSPDRVQSHWLSSVWGKKFTAPAQNGDDPYAAQIKNDAPTLWWRLNDSATATSAYDSSTNHFASTATGVAFAATPSPTQATALSAGFNGVESMISLPDTATVRGASASSGTTYSSHTVEFWFNAASLVNGKWYSLLGKGDFMTQSTSRTTGFMLYSDGTLHAIMSGMYTAYTAAGTIQPGRWYHAAYTWNGTSLLVYLNGQLVPTTLNAGANVSINVTDPFTVGNNPFTTAMLPFRGSIAEVAYYNVALSPDHLFEHYQASLYGELTPISAVATSNKVSLSWSAPSTSGGLSIVGYKIERSATVSTLGYSPNSVLSGTITVVTPNTGSAATTFDDTSVQNGNLYFYRVTPITNASTSIANPQPSGVIAAFPVNTPSAPASPTLSLWSNGGAALSWTAPVSNGGAVILGYVVQRRVEGGTYSADLGVTTQLRYRDTYPTPGVTYFYQVAAYNSAGRGAWAEVKFVPNIAPGIVYGPQITATVSGADPYATAVAADSPLLWWRLGDTSTVSTAKNFSSLLTTMDGTVGTGVTFGAASGANASPTTSGLGTATVAGTSTGAGAISLTSNAYTQLSAWTLETWVRLDALPSGLNWMRIVGKGNDGAGRNYELAVNANGQVRAVYDGYAGVTTALSLPGVMKAVSWYHLVFTFDGTNSRLYANGRFLASTALTIGNYNVPLISTSTTFSIDPVFATAGYTRFAGKIADVALYRTALTDSQAYSHWSSSLLARSPATDSYATEINTDAPLLWLRLNETGTATTAVNSGAGGSTLNGTLTVIPGRGDISQGPKPEFTDAPTTLGNKAMGFDGQGATVRIAMASTTQANREALTPAAASNTYYDATKAFTVEAWVYTPKTPSGSYNIMAKNATDNNTRGWQLSGVNYQLYFNVGPESKINTGSALSPGQWNHVVATYSGVPSSGASSLALYVNGAIFPSAFSDGALCSTVVAGVATTYTLAAYASCPIATLPPTSNDVWVGAGRFTSTANDATQGSLADVAFYTKTLTAADVSRHYRASVFAQAWPIRAVPGDGKIDLTWNAPTFAGGAPVVGYRIQYRIQGGGWSDLIANTNSTATSYTHFGLTNGTNYEYQVIAKNVNGETSFAPMYANAMPFALPGPVATLSATPGDKAVTLSWTAPPLTLLGGVPVSNYEFSYADALGTWSTPVLLPAATLTYTQSALTPGATYKFKIRTVNAFGYGPDPISTAVVQSGPVSGVAGLSATAGDGSVVLSWKPPSSTGGQTVNGYKIDMGTSGALVVGTGALATSSPVTSNTGNTSTSYTITGLSNGTIYYFQVSPLFGSGLTVGPVGITSGTPNVGPGPPLNLASTPGNQKVTLAWAPVVSDSYPILGYLVDYSTNGGLSWTPSTPFFVSGGSATGVVVGAAGAGGANLVNGTDYLFRVRTQYGPGGAPLISAGTTISGQPLANVTGPTGLVATANGAGSANLTWSLAADPAGSLTQAYKIDQSTDGSNWTSLTDNTGSQSRTYAATDLTPGTRYYFRVSSITSLYTTPPSESATVSILGAPSAPASISTTSGDSVIDVSWGAAPPSPGVTVTGYTVEYSINNVDWALMGNTDTATSHLTNYGLVNGVSYYFRVSATSTAGRGAYVTATATPAALSGAPLLMNATGGDARATLTWSAPNSSGGATISGYVIEQSLILGSWSTAVGNTNSASTTYVVSGLTNGTTISFRVRAITSAGPGNPSAGLTVTPYASPSAVQNLVAIGGAQSVQLTWDQPGTLGGSTMSSYLVERSLDGVTWTNGVTRTVTPSAATTGINYTYSALTNGQLYYFRITATTASALSSTPSLIAAIPASQADAPSGFTATPDVAGTLNLSWNAPTNSGGTGISEYWIEYTAGGVTRTAKTGSTDTSYSLSGLTAYTSYALQVYAYTTAAGTRSSTANATPLGLPAAPVLADPTTSSQQAVFVWPRVVDSATVTSYGVEYSTDGMTWRRALGSPFAQPVSGNVTVTLSGLTNGQQYLARITANASSGSSTYAMKNFIPAGAPNSPSWVDTTPSNGSVALRWSAPSDNGGSAVSSYTIVATASTGETITVSTGNANTSLVLTGLTNGKSYTAKIKAVTARSSAGAFSAASSSFTPAASSSSVSALSATAEDSQVTLTFTSVAGASFYEVGWSSSDGTDGLEVAAGSTGSTQTVVIPLLTNGLDYVFTVTTLNAARETQGSAVTTGTPGSRPDAPTGVTALPGAGNAIISWMAPANTGGAPLTAYIITPSSGSALNTGSTATSYTFSGLTNGTPYTFTVQAVSGFGTSVASSSSGVVIPATAPGSPTGLTVSSRNQSLLLTFAAPSSTGGVSLSGYVIETSGDGSTWIAVDPSNISRASATATTVTIAGLTNGSAIFVRVSAKNAANVVGAGAVATGTPLAPADAPTFSAVASDGSAKVSWIAPRNTGGADLDTFRILINYGGAYETQTVLAGVSEYTKSGLTNGVAVNFIVQSHTIAGYSTNNTPVSVTPVGVPGPIAIGTFTLTPTSGQVVATWLPPSSAGGSALTGYIAEASTDFGASWSTVATLGASDTRTVTISGLTNGVAVSVRISSVNAIGTSLGVSKQATPSGPPGRPSGLTATPSGVGVATLTWSSPSDTGGLSITGYIVQRRVQGTLTWSLATGDTGNNGTYYSATALDGGVTYEFRVAARNPIAGDYSEIASVTAAGSAGAPSINYITPTNKALALSWNAPTVAPGVTISGYEVGYSADGRNWNTASPSPSGTTYTLAPAAPNELVNGTPYLVRIAAIVGGASGTYFIGFGTPANVPAAPTSLVAAAQDSSVLLSWTTPSSNGSPISDYRVNISPARADSSVSVMVGSSSNAATVSGLTNGVSYTFSIQALNVAGYSSASASAIATPLVAPGAPKNLTLTPSSATQTTLTWIAPDTTTVTATPISYDLQWSSNGITWSNVETTTATAFTYTFTSGVADGSKFYARVAAVTVNGRGAFATTAISKGWKPSPTTAPAITSLSDKTVGLSWTAPASNGYPIVGYRVEYAAPGTLQSGSWTVAFANTGSNGTNAQFTSSALTNGTAYIFRVLGINGVGTAETGTASSNATPRALATSPQSLMVGPATYSVGTDSSGKLSLTWDPPAALGGGNIAYYLVQTSTDAVTWSAGDTTTAAPSNAGPFIVSGLTNGQPTYVRVAAVTEVGPGAWGTGSATPRTVPSGISNLSATSTDHALNLSWTAPATGGSPIVGYAVYIALSTDASYTLVTSNTNSLSTNYTVNTIGSSALANGTQYKTYVKAINAAGVGATSNVYTGVPAGPAAAPGSLIASPSSSTSVGLL
ncbi:MAG: fibronectin type III domain-containing protein [Actinomycetes bacterium]